MQCSDEHSPKVLRGLLIFILGVNNKAHQDVLWGVCTRSPGSPALDVSHMTFAQPFLTTVHYLRRPTKAVLVSSAPKPVTLPLLHSYSWDLTSPQLTSHLQQVPLEASARSGLKTSSQNLLNAKFQMVSTQNQESDQISLKTGPVSFKTCYRLQQTESGFWLSCETWNHMCSSWFRFLLWISYTALWE